MKIKFTISFKMTIIIILITGFLIGNLAYFNYQNNLRYYENIVKTPPEIIKKKTTLIKDPKILFLPSRNNFFSASSKPETLKNDVAASTPEIPANKISSCRSKAGGYILKSVSSM